MSILVNTGPTTLTATWYVNGTPTDVGDVTVGIDDADGNEVVASGTSTTNAGDGVYTYSLAIQTQVKDLTVTWTDVDATASIISTVEVVGGWLFTEAELRAHQGSDITAASYTDAQVNEVRDAIADEFEHICGVSFIPRYRKQTLKGSGDFRLELDRARIQSVIVATDSGSTLTAGNITPDDVAPFVDSTDAVFLQPSRSYPKNVTISYRHGYESVPPSIKKAALDLAVHRLKADVSGTGMPLTASSWNDGSGNFSFGANDQTGRWYGMPSVDSALRRYMARSPVF